MIYSVTYYLELCSAIYTYICCISSISPTNVELVVWTTENQQLYVVKNHINTKNMCKPI